MLPNPPNEHEDGRSSLEEASSPAELHAPSPFRPISSWVLDLLAGGVLFAGVFGLAWLVWSTPRLERIPMAEDALELIVSRTMDMEEAMGGVAEWEQLLFDVISGGGQELQQTTAWYEELVATSSDPLPQLYLTILQAEADRMAQVRERIDSWPSREAPFPQFHRFIEGAYLREALDHAAEFQLQAELSEALPAGWFYDRLALGLAKESGNETRLSATREAGQVRAEALLERARGFMGIELTLLATGSVMLLMVLARRSDREALVVAGAYIPPPWRGRVGVTVLLRGGACGLLLMVTFMFGLGFSPVHRLVALPLVHMPLLLMTYRYLLKPAGVGFRAGFGLWPMSGGVTRLLMVVLALIAAGELVDWGLSLTSESLGFSLHWTEWFDPELAWGNWEGVGASLIEYVVYAPVLEEVAFRGILFGTLRRRLGFGSSASLSALIFAMAHGYGLLGFLSIWWSGVLWAWGYERTGSLLPGMIAHSLNNLLVSSSMLLFLR